MCAAPCGLVSTPPPPPRLPPHVPQGGLENGLLRLHSTYRHDLKIYTADEGRVQSSAAAFTKVTRHRDDVWAVLGLSISVT